MSLLRQWYNSVVRRPRAKRAVLPPSASTVLVATIIVVLTVITNATATANSPSSVSGPARVQADDDSVFIDYNIVVSSATAPWVDVEMTVTPVQPGALVEIQLPERASSASITPHDDSTHVSCLADRIVGIHSGAGGPLTFTYSVRLHAGVINPAALPSSPYASVHLGEFVYIAGHDTLAHVIGDARRRHVTVSVSTPVDWHVFSIGNGEVPREESVSVSDPSALVLLAGPLTIARHEADGMNVALVVAGDMPWSVDEAIESVTAMMTSLHKWGFADYAAPTTFVQLRYPGPLRLNPLITSIAVPDNTIVHWIGTGGTDWWRKHAARDVVRWLVDRTLTLAPDATWFTSGVPEYVALLLLHEAGYETDLEMYRALRALYQTGVRYTGPGWPSLAQAGAAEPRSHAAHRVLEFQAPAVAFLLDAEIRSASGGAASLIDLWLAAAAAQRRQPGRQLDTASLLSVRSDYGDLNTFANSYLFGTRIPPIHFDTVFQRWSVKQ